MNNLFKILFPLLLAPYFLVAAKKHPNLVLIMADDMGYECLGAEYKSRESIYMWYAHNGGPTGQEFARNQRYKLYRTGKFYDVQEDRLEKKPLSGDNLDKNQGAIRDRLRKTLEAFKDAGTITSKKLPGEESTNKKKKVNNK